MRINVNSADPTQTLGSASQAGASGQPPRAHHGHHRGGCDLVQISDAAAQLAADPSSDAAKLAQLQAAHNTGTYQVSPSQVANSIINAHMIAA